MGAQTTLPQVTHGATDIEQSMEDALQIIGSWPTWKIASMFDGDSQLPQELQELLDEFHGTND